MNALTQDDLVEQLRGKGLRVTAQRLDVHAALVQLGTHATPEEILKQVRMRQPSISLNTVYATLETLTAASVIRRGDTAAGPLRYDANTNPHHHLVCRRCGLQVDVECVTGATQCLEAGDEHGFRIDEAQVTFYGLCAACAAGSESSKTT